MRHHHLDQANVAIKLIIDRDTLGIDPVGNYFNSRVQSKGIRTFGKPKTVSLFPISESPGPGTYYHFPEFPTYLSR